MPVEVLVLVYRNLDSIRDVLNLASACHLLSSVWKKDTYDILHTTLSRQLLSYDMAMDLFTVQLWHLYHTINPIAREIEHSNEEELVKILQGDQPVTGYFLDKEKGVLWFYTLEIQSIIDQHFAEGTSWDPTLVYCLTRLYILCCFFPQLRKGIEDRLNKFNTSELAGIEQVVRLLWNRAIFMFKLKCEHAIGGVGAPGMEQTPAEEWQEILDMVSKAHSKAAKTDE